MNYLSIILLLFLLMGASECQKGNSTSNDSPFASDSSQITGTDNQTLINLTVQAQAILKLTARGVIRIQVGKLVILMMLQSGLIVVGVLFKAKEMITLILLKEQIIVAQQDFSQICPLVEELMLQSPMLNVICGKDAGSQRSKTFNEVFMKKLVSFIVSVISVGVLAGEGSLLINVELFPVGSFDIKSTTFKGGKLKKKGNKFMVKNIYVPVPTMETGIKLRDEHMRKRLGGKKGISEESCW